MQSTRPPREGVYWFLFFLAFWWLLAAGQGWGFGLPVAALAALLCYWLGTPFWRFRPLALPGFCLFFLWELAQAGWDVGRRVCDPRLPIAPAWVQYPLQQTSPRVTLLLSAMVCLLPGTLATRVTGGHLAIHTLNRHQDWQQTVVRLEQQLARLLGESRP